MMISIGAKDNISTALENDMFKVHQRQKKTNRNPSVTGHVSLQTLNGPPAGILIDLGNSFIV